MADIEVLGSKLASLAKPNLAKNIMASKRFQFPMMM